MCERDVREVSRIRQELRERLMGEKLEGVSDVLACLARLAEKDVLSELRQEVERWRLRFDLLSSLAMAR